jgi:hypothetical protein
MPKSKNPSMEDLISTSLAETPTLKKLNISEHGGLPKLI